MHYDTIPQELKTIDRWMPFRFVWNDHSQKYGKVPHHINGYKGSKSNPRHWVSFEHAAAAVAAGRFDGIGFVLWEDDDIIAVDIDSCIVDGEPNALARSIIERLNTYTEYSPSGKGLRLFLRGRIQRNHNSKQHGLELYHHASYVTVTGQHLPGTPQKVMTRVTEIAALEREFWPEISTHAKPSQHNKPQYGFSLEMWAEILKYIPPKGDYQDHWLTVLMGMHYELGDAAIPLLEAWSPGYPGEIVEKFASFKRETGPAVTGATVLSIAIQHGYKMIANDLQGGAPH